MEDLNERQIQILRLLAGQTEPLRNPELARRFGCSIKTIQRDFKRIEILGLSLGYTLLRSSQGIVLDCGNADRGRLNRWIYGGDRLSSGDSVCFSTRLSPRQSAAFRKRIMSEAVRL